MVQHTKCDKIADVDKFFEKSGMPLDRVNYPPPKGGELLVLPSSPSLA